MWLSDPGVMCTCGFFWRKKSPESVKSSESANQPQIYVYIWSTFTGHQEHPSQLHLTQETGNSTSTLIS